jgi:hypothetical protein
MDELLVVAHPEDLVTEFLSVLAEGTALTVLIAGSRQVLALPAGTLDDRLTAVAALDVESGEPCRERIAAAATGARVWTHNPADERLDRARVAAWAASAAGQAICSTGVSTSLRFVADRAAPLTRGQIEAKLDVIGALPPGGRPIPLAAVADCERYFAASGAVARQLYGLRHGHDPLVGLDAEPWDFATSPYEQERLAATAAWVRRSAAGTITELGACEGALTELLLAAGCDVAAHEPDERFLARLRHRLDGRPGLRIGPESLEELATGAPPAGGPFLLAEMVYYLADLAILDALPTTELFLSVAPYVLRTRVLPWLHASDVWDAVEIVDLAAPRFELVCGGVAYQRKAGSRGVHCRRRVSSGAHTG